MPTAEPTETGLVEEDLSLSEGDHIGHSQRRRSYSENGIFCDRDYGIGSKYTPFMYTGVLPQTVFAPGEEITFVAMTSDQETALDDLISSWRSDLDGDLGAGALSSGGEALVLV